MDEYFKTIDNELRKALGIEEHWHSDLSDPINDIKTGMGFIKGGTGLSTYNRPNFPIGIALGGQDSNGYIPISLNNGMHAKYQAASNTILFDDTDTYADPGLIKPGQLIYMNDSISRIS